VPDHRLPLPRPETDLLVSRILIIATVVLATLAAASVGALAWADGSAAEKLPNGARVAGVDVGGMTRDEALQRAQRRVSALILRPVNVQLGDKRYTLTAQQAHTRIDLKSAVERAYADGREGSFVERGWRKISGKSIDADIPVPATVDRSAVGSFIGRIEHKQALDPVDASLNLTLTKVTVNPPKDGRRLAARDALIARLIRRLTSRTDDRTIRAKTVPVKAKLGADKVFDAQPMALTVSRNETTVRLFKRGKLVKSYRVAVGSPEFPTPTGRFVVQSMQKNPSWNVPNSAWAGSLAGTTIPGGDPNNPLVARWIGFNGSVGFHGTNNGGSLGSAASHGCIRMDPNDVIDLFQRVSVGTPVYVE
jgi:lipoprotein-anchoring transpeptidase ErfK/SrfK